MISRSMLAAALLAVCSAQPAQSATFKEQLGRVHFETSCNRTAQKLFDRGMLYQHSFWYSAAKRTFEDVVKADPQCAIAYWGIALSYLYNPHAPPPPENLHWALMPSRRARHSAPRRSASAITSMRSLPCTWITISSIIARASRTTS